MSNLRINVKKRLKIGKFMSLEKGVRLRQNCQELMSTAQIMKPNLPMKMDNRAKIQKVFS